MADVSESKRSENNCWARSEVEVNSDAARTVKAGVFMVVMRRGFSLIGGEPIEAAGDLHADSTGLNIRIGSVEQRF